jgi:hypothetical protein
VQSPGEDPGPGLAELPVEGVEPFADLGEHLGGGQVVPAGLHDVEQVVLHVHLLL